VASPTPREHLALRERFGDRLPLADAAARLDDRLLDDLVPGGFRNDVHALENGDAAADHRPEGSGEPRHGDPLQQGADHREPQQEPVDVPAAGFLPIVPAEHPTEHEEKGDDDQEIFPREVADPQDDLCGTGERLPEIGEHLREDRDDVHEQDDRDDDGDGDDRGRIDHRALDLLGQLHRLLDVVGEAGQDRIENAAHLPRGDEVDEEGVEDLRVAGQRVGEGGAALHVLLDLEDHLLERRVLLLRPEDVQALDEGKPRVDHGGELAGEDGELLPGDFLLPLPGEGDPQVRAFLPDPQRRDLLPAQLGEDERLVRGFHLPRDRPPSAVLPFPREFRHRLLRRSFRENIRPCGRAPAGGSAPPSADYGIRRGRNCAPPRRPA